MQGRARPLGSQASDLRSRWAGAAVVEGEPGESGVGAEAEGSMGWISVSLGSLGASSWRGGLRAEAQMCGEARIRALLARPAQPAGLWRGKTAVLLRFLPEAWRPPGPLLALAWEPSSSARCSLRGPALAPREGRRVLPGLFTLSWTGLGRSCPSLHGARAGLRSVRPRGGPPCPQPPRRCRRQKQAE